MARKIPYLLIRDGRYFARRTVPPKLQPYIGTVELREPLGPDRKIALDKLHLALVQMNLRLDHARRQLEAQQGVDAAKSAARSAPMTTEELARTHYNDQLALDQALRDYGPAWASIGINDAYVADLRAASSGSLQNEQIENLLGSFLKRYSLRGNLDAAHGTPEWRNAARAIAEAELQVLARMYDRDEGMLAHEMVHPPHLARVIEKAIDKSREITLRRQAFAPVSDRSAHQRIHQRGQTVRPEHPRSPIPG